MKYFEMYELPVSFLLDEKLIRQKFLDLTKKYHPDFFTQSSGKTQQEALELTTLNNKAFQTLSDFHKRMQYILKEVGVLEEEEKYQLPQIFLMEMMDLNEMLAEMKFDPDPNKKEEVIAHLQETAKHLYKEAEPFLIGYDWQNTDLETYKHIKEYYYKSRYLARIKDQIEKLDS